MNSLRKIGDYAAFKEMVKLAKIILIKDDDVVRVLKENDRNQAIGHLGWGKRSVAETAFTKVVEQGDPRIFMEANELAQRFPNRLESLVIRRAIEELYPVTKTVVA